MHKRWFWTGEEDAYLLRAYIDPRVSIEEIAARVRRTPHAVTMRARAMGLPYRPPYTGNPETPFHKRLNATERRDKAKEIFRGTDEDAAGVEDAAEHKRIVDEARKAVIGEQLQRAIRRGHL